MVIWRDSCRKESVFRGRSELIGAYDQVPLKLSDLKPFRRALSYQAYFAYNNLSIPEKEKWQLSVQKYFVPVGPQFSFSQKKEKEDFFLFMEEGKTPDYSNTARTVEATLMTAIKEEGLDSDEDF